MKNQSYFNAQGQTHAQTQACKGKVSGQGSERCGGDRRGLGGDGGTGHGVHAHTHTHTSALPGHRHHSLMSPSRHHFHESMCGMKALCCVLQSRDSQNATIKNEPMDSTRAKSDVVLLNADAPLPSLSTVQDVSQSSDIERLNNPDGNTNSTEAVTNDLGILHHRCKFLMTQ